jgi:hypothetical protein
MNLQFTQYTAPSNFTGLPPTIDLSYNANTGIITYSIQHASYTDNVATIVSNTSTGNIETVMVETTIPASNASHTLNVYSLYARTDCYDHSLYYVTWTGNVVEMFSQTLPTKGDLGELANQLKSSEADGSYGRAYLVAIPVVNDISSTSVKLTTMETANVSIGGDFVTSNLGSTNVLVRTLMPQITFATPNRTGNTITIPVTLSHNATVRYETTVGSLMTPRLTGNGNLIIDVTNVPTGLEGRIKASFKYFPGREYTNFTT